MKTLFISALFILILAGCGQSGSEPDNSKKEIWPLAIGNSWTYSNIVFRNIGTDSVYFLDSLTYTYKVEDTININGEIWYRFSYNGKVSNKLYTNRVSGLYEISEYDTSMTNFETAQLFMKFPVELNETFNIRDREYTVLDLKSKITTPAGTFNCIKYRDITNNGKSEQYWCQGIGSVLFKSYYETITENLKTDTVWSKTELINYKIN